MSVYRFSHSTCRFSKLFLTKKLIKEIFLTGNSLPCNRCSRPWRSMSTRLPMALDNGSIEGIRSAMHDRRLSSTSAQQFPCRIPRSRGHSPSWRCRPWQPAVWCSPPRHPLAGVCCYRSRPPSALLHLKMITPVPWVHCTETRERRLYWYKKYNSRLSFFTRGFRTVYKI